MDLATIFWKKTSGNFIAEHYMDFSMGIGMTSLFHDNQPMPWY